VKFAGGARTKLDAVPVGRKVVEFAGEEKTDKDGINIPVPVADIFVELVGGESKALTAVPTGRLAFKESVGTLEDGALVGRTPVELTERIGTALDAVPTTILE
jgi:hypothetical protein